MAPDPHISNLAKGCTALLCLAGVVVFLVLSACTQVPELDNVIEPRLERAAYPDLVPLQQVLAVQKPPGEASRDLEEELNARRARLQSKARELNAADDFE